MASNDETVLAFPQIQCTGCEQLFLISRERILRKYSKEQRAKQFDSAQNQCAEPYSRRWLEDSPSSDPELAFVVVTCENIRCQQYNRFKVVKLPKLHAPSVTLNLE